MTVTPEGTDGHELRRELRMIDLVFTQILIVVGGSWIGTAAKLGRGHVVLWLLAGVLFFVPLIVVVVHLTRWRPLEGGLYQWAKLAFGEKLGFIVGWNLWLYIIVFVSSLGLDCVTLLSYSLGERTAGLATNRPLIVGSTVLLIAGMAGLAIVGLGIGKWVHTVGGVVRVLCYAALILLPIVRLLTGDNLPNYGIAPVAPEVSLLSINILAKMGFGAFSGFEYVAIFAGESHDPARSIVRSVYVSAPVVVLMFLLGSASVAAFVPADSVDLIAPLPQALAAGAGQGPARIVAPIAAVAMAISLVAYGSATFSASARLPMVAGWDGLLPGVFGRLHPRYRTPYGAILLVAGVTIVFGIASLSGVGEQEAFQLILNAAMISYALTYLVMFAIPFTRARAEEPHASVWVKFCAASGFAMTVFFIAFALVPVVRVESTLGFGMKVAGVAVGANLVGLALFMAERRRRDASVKTHGAVFPVDGGR